MHFVPSACLTVLLLASAAVAQPRNPGPHSAIRAEVRVVGEALDTALPRVGKVFDVQLSASRALQSQRITVYGKDCTVNNFSDALQQLLTPAEDAPVLWARKGDARWTLEQSHNRRRLAEQLRDMDLDLYRQHLDKTIRWAKDQGLAEVEGAAGNPELQKGIQQRYSQALLLDGLGVVGRERLLRGEPIILRAPDLPFEQAEALRSYLSAMSPTLASGPRENLDSIYLAVTLARTPTDPQGAHLVMTVTQPGVRITRFTQLRIPHPLTMPNLLTISNLAPASPRDMSRRVSFCLTPVPDAKPGALVERNLDQLLEVVARETGINVVADGYLRSSTKILANLQVRDYPLHSLLNQLSGLWGFDWRYQNADEKTILVRTQGWWLEDEADVPQPVLEELMQQFGPNQAPKLEDLLRLAELSRAQVHKLMECGFCPGATGVVSQGWYDGTDALTCLRFFKRLPKPLQRQALSETGLPLRNAPPALVQSHLYTTLVTNVCAVTPELQADLVFSIHPVVADQHKRPGFVVKIASGKDKGTKRHWLIQQPGLIR